MTKKMKNGTFYFKYGELIKYKKKMISGKVIRVSKRYKIAEFCYDKSFIIAYDS